MKKKKKKKNYILKYIFIYKLLKVTSIIRNNYNTLALFL